MLLRSKRVGADSITIQLLNGDEYTFQSENAEDIRQVMNATQNNISNIDILVDCVLFKWSEKRLETSTCNGTTLQTQQQQRTTHL